MKYISPGISPPIISSPTTSSLVISSPIEVSDSITLSGSLIITGSILPSGSLLMDGDVNITGDTTFTRPPIFLNPNISVTSSWAENVISSSYALTASYIPGIPVTEIGIATLNFGSAPGTNITTASISTSNISDNSSINIYIMNTSSVDHNTADHQIFALYSKVIPGNIVNNTSFDITCISDLRINGTFKAKYIINN